MMSFAVYKKFVAFLDYLSKGEKRIELKMRLGSSNSERTVSKIRKDGLVSILYE